MHARAAVPVLAVLLIAGAVVAADAPTVDKKDMTSSVKLEHLVTGHLTELNGHYKLRATETVYAPGGFIGEHHHVGPGIRYVAEGELTYVQPNRTTIYRTGDYFYESGDTTHTASNRTSGVVRIINFGVVAGGLEGSDRDPAHALTAGTHGPRSGHRRLDPGATWSFRRPPMRSRP